jgi:hypothetical protein
MNVFLHPRLVSPQIAQLCKRFALALTWVRYDERRGYAGQLTDDSAAILCCPRCEGSPHVSSSRLPAHIAYFSAPTCPQCGCEAVPVAQLSKEPPA